MRNLLAEGATPATPMPLFGAAHLLPVLLLVVFVVFLVDVKKSSFTQSFRTRLGSGLAWMLSLNYLGYVVFGFFEGSLSWEESLPLYPCALSSVLAPVYWRSKNTTLFNLLFYWVFAGALQAVITPEVNSTFPSYEYFYFWVCHLGLFAFLFFLLIVEDEEPTLRGIGPAFGGFCVMIVLSSVTNHLTGANYYYLIEKPSVPSVMDYLGPWPVYIFGAIALSLVQFVLAFVGFRFLKTRSLNKRRSGGRNPRGDVKVDFSSALVAPLQKLDGE